MRCPRARCTTRPRWRAHVPTVMLFSSSTNGISHAKEEDTPIEHLELAIRAYAQTVGAAIDRVASA